MAVQQLSRAAGHSRQCQMPSLDRIGLVSAALGRPVPAQRRPEPEEPLRKYQNWLPGGSADVGGARRLCWWWMIHIRWIRRHRIPSATPRWNGGMAPWLRALMIWPGVIRCDHAASAGG